MNEEISKDLYAPKLKEVARSKRAILYEDQNIYSNDECSINGLRHIFPDYDYNICKNYFIEIDNHLYYGEEFTPDVYFNYEEEE